jgi:serine/threonine-protein kinase
MGEVYRATDTKLNRDVALKILPEQFASDSQRMGRFQREAEVLASLDHPNIGQIYGIEEAGQTKALVLQLIEGPTLADKIAQGPIPVEEALKIALQMAEGLEAAHEKGVIHRDLKPANIKITPEGQVKILDFGLAKALEAEVPVSSLSQSPTLTNAATQAGVILGTAAYMSPEQAKGKPVDKRADVFAFGAVLYEMLTGKRAFEGEDVSDTLASILAREPDYTRLPANLHPRLPELLDRCLGKDPKRRWQAIGDVRIEIEQVLGNPTIATIETVAGIEPQSRLRLVAPWLLVSALSASLIIGFAAWNLYTPAPLMNAVSHLSVDIRPAQRLGGPPAATCCPQILTRTSIALSPDGRQFVFAGWNGGAQQLYRRSLDQSEAQAIPGTEGAANPFFSPDGEWVGFWAAGQLKKIALAGGPPVPLCETGMIFGASWETNDFIVFAGSEGGLQSVSAEGGAPRRLTEMETEQASWSHRLPWVLPGGDAVLFTIFKLSQRWDEAQVAVQSLITGERRVLIEGGAHPMYTPTGHLIFARLGTLWAAPFDVSTLTVTSPAVPVLEGVTQAANLSGMPVDTGAAQFSVSTSGTLLYAPGGLLQTDSRALVWVDRRGRTEPLNVPRGEYWNPRVSPDGQRVAVSDQAQNAVFVFDLRRNIVQRLQGAGLNVGTWSPDSREIVFGWIETGPRNLFRQLADGSQPPQRLTRSPNMQFAGPWSPDGAELLVMEQRADSGADILVLKPDQPDELLRPLLTDAFDEEQPALSPDGRWLAYTSNESGRNEVYMRAYPDLQEKQQISNDGGYINMVAGWRRALLSPAEADRRRRESYDGGRNHGRPILSGWNTDSAFSGAVSG